MASESTPGTFFGVAEEKNFWSGLKVDWLAAFLCKFNQNLQISESGRKQILKS